MKIREKDINNILEVAYTDIKSMLEPKDGFQHILMLNDNIDDLKVRNHYGNPEYTSYINNILRNLQKDNYEILDIKITSIYCSATGTEVQCIIIYK